jgi:hypothetical protein
MLVLLAGCGGGPPNAAEPTPSPHDGEISSASPDHLIYLHGAIIEDQGPRPTHPRFGIYEYQQILDAFAAAGFEVSSDLRPAQTQPREYAARTAAQVRALIDDGVPPTDITVVGFSKGGVIAVLTALELDNPEINYVFIACCVPFLEGAVASSGGQIQGRMLSIRELSDNLGSCNTVFELASPASETEEIELQLGGGHGAFYRPHPEWIDPIVRWALSGSRRTAGVAPESLFTYEADAAPSTGGGLSRGVAWGDFDTDGDADLVVANAVGQAQMLYRNNASGMGWIVLRLSGTESWRSPKDRIRVSPKYS